VGLPTALERIKAVHREFMILKNSFKIPFYKLFPTIVLLLGLDDIFQNLSLSQVHRLSFIFSNVAGPREPLLMYGKPLQDAAIYYPNLIHQVIMFSYNNKISISMVLDTENIRHPKLLQQSFLDELNAMKKEFLRK